MAKEVQTYYVSRFVDGRVYIGLTYTDGTCYTLHARDANDAMLLVDILRNERPVYVDSHGTLYTGLEPVGEGNEPPQQY